ncbi:MAG: nitrilase-related carbon-nitrogen hydrolase [Lachnospirales bacterium]
MIVSLCQLNIVWENKKANVEKVDKFCNLAKNKNSHIIFFPEMSLTGFSLEVNRTKENGESINIIKNIAKKYNIAIGFGWVKDCGLKGENVYTIINQNGEVISEYTKIHPFSFSGEDKYFNKGDKLSVFNFMGFNIGSLICYDLRFPEIFQALSKNCHLIVVPACWPEKRSDHFKTLLKARAIENQCYILGVNCVGDVGGLYYSGDSMIINPEGKIIDCLSNKEGLILADIDNDVDVFRNLFPTKKDRQPNLYRQLL